MKLEFFIKYQKGTFPIMVAIPQQTGRNQDEMRLEAENKNGILGQAPHQAKDVVSLANYIIDTYTLYRKQQPVQELPNNPYFGLSISPTAERKIGRKGFHLLEEIIHLENSYNAAMFNSASLGRSIFR